jgi:MoxR-like ATPase
LAIEEVRRGRNLVIQGPPGTGKSQTIANLIAAAVVLTSSPRIEPRRVRES